MQLVEADAPVVVRYTPTAQLVQLVVPVATANMPAPQPMQLVDSTAPVEDRYKPAAQLAQPAIPVAVAN